MPSVEDNAELLLAELYASLNPGVNTLTVVSGTAQQDASGVWSTIVVGITGASAGTVHVEIGPTNAVADSVIPVVAANAVASQQVSFRLPPGWWFKVTATTASIANATQVFGA